MDFDPRRRTALARIAAAGLAGGWSVAGAAPPIQPTPPALGPRLVSAPLTGFRTFDVGPGRTYTELDALNWPDIRAGDVVNVFHRPQPYRTKIAIGAIGTRADPIVLNGVTSPTGELPEITGADARTPESLRGWFDQHTESLGVILCHHKTWARKVENVLIQHLKVTGCHPNYSYTNQAGARVAWSEGAGIYGVTVDGLSLFNVEVTDNATGVFTNTRGNSEEQTSYRLSIRRSRIYDNGVVGSYRRHNIYAQAVGFVIEDSYVGHLRPGALGSSLKTRSSGEVIRRCRIDAAARGLDLVEHEEGLIIFRQPDYHSPLVEDCTIVSQFGAGHQAAATPVHFGGDNGYDAPTFEAYKRGPLRFRRNVLAILDVDRAQSWRVIAFDLPRAEQTVECESSVICRTGNSILQTARSAGTVRWIGDNYASAGMVAGEKASNSAVVIEGAPTRTGSGAVLDANARPIGAAAGLGPAATRT